jgi:hypothetical protein
VLDERWEAQRRVARERAQEVVHQLDLDIDQLPGRLPEAFRGTASPEDMQALIDSPTDGELRALEKVVLSADLDPEVKVDMLTDLGLATAMAQLRLEAERMALEADSRAEAELRRIEEETTAAISAIEHDYHRRVAATIEAATQASRRVDRDAAERLRQVAADTEQKAAQAGRDARVKARRAARQRARRRSR